MTPSELKVKLLKDMEREIDKYMDGSIDGHELVDSTTDLVDDFIDEHEKL